MSQSRPNIDLEGVRTFVTVVRTGQFQKAASALAISQQAVSKRIAALERALSSRLLVRAPGSVQLTAEGRAFLPHAHALLRAEELAREAVLPMRRALRVDVVDARVGPARVLRDFHATHPGVPLEIVTHLFDAERALASLSAGEIDVTFRALTNPGRQLDDRLAAERVFDDPVEVLVSHRHALGAKVAVHPSELARHRIWMPAIVPGTEWAAYYDEMAAAFGLTIESAGPNFGIDAVVAAVARSSTVATLVGEHMELTWPAHYRVRRVPVHGPKVVYPHFLVWRREDVSSSLTALRTYVARRRDRYLQPDAWVPRWASASNRES